MDRIRPAMSVALLTERKAVGRRLHRSLRFPDKVVRVRNPREGSDSASSDSPEAASAARGATDGGCR